ncbi:MAG: UDP-2,3-diacylglucosamine diphosphatase [Bacteroidota bacterium]
MSKHIYFVSDVHLGAPSPERSLTREKHLVKWLESIREKASAIYILGDLFDFWFEYKHAVPKGYVRLLGTLASMADQGIDIHIFSGNHDLWYKDYLEKEVGANLHFKPHRASFFGKKYYMAHGDGLGPGDHGYKLMKKVVTHPSMKWLFSRLHPNFGIGLALGVSKHGGNHDYEHKDNGDWRYQLHPATEAHVLEVLEEEEFDYLIFGHRHALVRKKVTDVAEAFVLGDWIMFFSYLEISPDGPELKQFPLEEKEKAKES